MKAVKKPLKTDNEPKDIFSFMDTVVKNKKIAPLRMMQMEKVVHVVRASI